MNDVNKAVKLLANQLRVPSRDTDDRPSYVTAATASSSASNQRPRSSRTVEVPPTNQQPRAPSTRPNHTVIIDCLMKHYHRHNLFLSARMHINPVSTRILCIGNTAIF